MVQPHPAATPTLSPSVMPLVVQPCPDATPTCPGHASCGPATASCHTPHCPLPCPSWASYGQLSQPCCHPVPHSLLAQKPWPASPSAGYLLAVGPLLFISVCDVWLQLFSHGQAYAINLAAVGTVAFGCTGRDWARAGWTPRVPGTQCAPAACSGTGSRLAAGIPHGCTCSNVSCLHTGPHSVRGTHCGHTGAEAVAWAGGNWPPKSR